MFIKMNDTPSIQSQNHAYETPGTIFCDGKKAVNITLEQLIEDNENWGTLYAVVCIYWLERVFPSKKAHAGKHSHSSIIIPYEVKTELIDTLLEQLFEKLVTDKSEQGDRRRVTVMNLSERGRLLGEELFTKHTSITLEHFYWNQEMPNEARAKQFEWYEYKPDGRQNDAKEFEESLDNDWFMQYLIQTPGMALEATSLSQKELNEDIFVQYLAGHAKELYLAVDPKIYPIVENPLYVKNRKQLFWNR